MEEIINLSLVLFFFLLIVFIVCFILQVFLRIFGKKKQPNKFIEKDLKKHSSTQETNNQDNSGGNANDAEASWMNAVMTATFITASMKSTTDHSEGDECSHDSPNHSDQFDSPDS
ncbi:hypothetical protein [Bacillus thuringiensis]|uniref:Uncharacterized protein n=1 Tax=Bacillus thuringiensis subsp. finitimus TaxID=29337 RepID=A0A243GFM1_BACTF|nr:hypothetical protein [Bacillus thuringiensis]ALQ69373.1 hypothetical protein ATN06_19050 [Bacillus thuringiensis]OUA06282.1 hypothetical protein BK772_25980 [Bacillus thuringiensis serovar finitimus]